MKVIIPMAGIGERFLKAGYKDPKPLIMVDGKRIIEYIVDMFNRQEDEFIFVCNEQHVERYYMKEILQSLVSKSTTIGVDTHTKGPVYTVVNSGAMDLISDDEPVIVSYCDNPFLFNPKHFDAHRIINHWDGAIFSHVGFHPHRLSSTYMAYMRVKPASKGYPWDVVEQIQEKNPFTENHLSEHASTGTYYFKRGSYIKKYFPLLIESDMNYNGEYYVTLVYNLMIADTLLVTAYPTRFVTVFGTPEEVQNFEAWQTILKGAQVGNMHDARECYTYWDMYNLLCKNKESL